MNQAVTGQGSNSATVRQCNERVILALLRRLGQASKSELARQAHLTQNTAGQIVKDLKQQNLVCLAGKRSGRRGQPATLLQLDPTGACSIGVEVGRGTLISLLVDFNGTVLKSRRHRRALPLPEEALRIVGEDIAILRRSLPPARKDRLAGIGLAMPNTLGNWQRELDLPEDTCSARDAFDFAGRLRAALGLPVLVENHGTAVAVAELFQDHGRDLDDFAVVYIGAVIARGLVLDGTYRRGITGHAGDIGSMPVASPDNLLSRASAAALIWHLQDNGVPVTNQAEFERIAATGSSLIEEWLDHCADVLINPLRSVASLLDLQTIVIDGTLPRPLIGQLVERLRIRLLVNVPNAMHRPVLKAGTFGRNAAMMGAAALPLHFHYRPRHDLLLAR